MTSTSGRTSREERKPKSRKSRKPAGTGAIAQHVFLDEVAWWKARCLCRIPFVGPDPFEDSAKNLCRESPAYAHLGLTRAARFSQERKRALLEERIAQLDAHRPPPGNASRNIEHLKRMLHLDDAACTVLRHAVTFQDSLRTGYALDRLCDGNNGFEVVMDALARAWEVDPNKWRAALEPDSPLIRCGIISIEEDEGTTDKQISINARLGRLIVRSDDAVNRFITTFVDSAPHRDLTTADFPHLERFRDLLEATLRNPREGIPAHILLSGSPGTGKSQFALALAAESGCDALLLRTETDKGEILDGEGRRAALGLIRQTMAARPGTVLIVDEAENLLDSDAMAILVGRDTVPSSAKAWLNRLLENNRVPMIWIVNSPEVFDPSILRRFTWHVPFRPPPRSVRKQILLRHLGNLDLSEPFLDELAHRDDLPPHEASRLARAASFAPAGVTTESVIRIALEGSDRLLGRTAPLRVTHATTFDPALLNTDADVVRLLSTLERRGCGRLGFFGPPGTGKSMLATEIARLTGRPLHQKTGSDLLSKYVGGTEKLIANAFEEAADEGAVLFLDEVDGLVSDRDKAVRSWERTQVNELLVRLERFPGIAILATNAADALDPAVMRRLDVKVEFGPLNRDQAWTLFLRHAPAATLRIRERLNTLELRLGDFGTSLRGIQAQGVKLDSASLLEALESEVEFRQPRARVG